MGEKMIGHLMITTKGDIYINVPRNTELYKLLRAVIDENGGSTRGIRVELEIENARVRRIKLE